MRFSFFAVLSGLAALAVVNAVPAENLNLRADVDVSQLKTCSCDDIVCKLDIENCEVGYFWGYARGACCK
ncbi:hypothetical protein OG21DRAFT_1489453 [Imleria badia]|nr:hypothetical protein OG21DRAFT_1489453 [Imleria badia]